MSDVSEKKPLESKFFTALRPYFAFVDSTRFFTIPFSWLYVLFAVVFLLAPFAVLYYLIDNGFFRQSGKIIAGGVLCWIAILVASWIAFQVWWNRKKVVNTDKLDISVIINALAHLVYTFCEALAHFAGVAGFFTGFFALIFGAGVLRFFGPGSSSPLALMICSLVGGYLGVWAARLAAFLFRKIAEIIVYVVVRIFKFVVHIIKQLFEYFFIFWQSFVDFIVNGWTVVVALVAKLGNTLLAIAHAPVNSNRASITYNND
ncbi:MAG: hypothetical protein LBK08_05960 [Treponema sp.]|jgi:hypothetical protein|nr:hypothetical protein [Treponema sp.]